MVTLVKGRRKQLANLLDSIKQSTIFPFDIQIICMDNLAGIEIPEGLKVNIKLIKDDHSLPLASARNMGISTAETDNIIFIDVDCIVSPSLFESMLMNLTEENIIVAYPLYLPIVPENGTYSELIHNAIPHPERKHIPSNEPIPHLKFWSLIFAIKKATFGKIGGFDENFTGYGAEDTDFAMSFNSEGIKQIFVRDYILHQYHDKFDPPLNYFESIIKNAKQYKIKWKVLPMQRWLRRFEELGLIKIDEDDDITIIQKPTEIQIKNSVSPNPY